MTTPARVQTATSGLVKTYAGPRSVCALDGASLSVKRGTVAAVLGASGCGKSTLLRVIAGVEQPDAGTVHIAGEEVEGPSVRVPPERRRVGLVPQAGVLFPHLDVAGNIGFGLRTLARDARRARVAAMLDLVGLAGYERRRPNELSGGQQQRVALARALAPNPAVVLLDEPFSALDAGLRTTIRSDVATMLREAEATALLVTHDQSEAFTLADTVAVMSQGRIVQHAVPEVVYNRSANLWTAQLVGASVVIPGTYRSSPAPSVDCVFGRLGVHMPPEVSTGDAVVVLIRPEQLRPVADPSPSSVGAEVVSCRFGGVETDVVLRIDGYEIATRVPSALWPTSIAESVHIDVMGMVQAFPVNMPANGSVAVHE